MWVQHGTSETEVVALHKFYKLVPDASFLFDGFDECEKENRQNHQGEKMHWRRVCERFEVVVT